MGVPTMYVRLLEEPALSIELASAMRLFISGSAPLLPDTFRAFEARTGHRILERYGMSETVMLSSNPYDGNRVAGTVGLSLPGVEIRVRDDEGKPCAADEIGGIQVRGPNVFSAYWRMPDKTREEFTEDGWFRTGDVGRWDANGYLSIVGRSKDLIISHSVLLVVSSPTSSATGQCKAWATCWSTRIEALPTPYSRLARCRSETPAAWAAARRVIPWRARRLRTRCPSRIKYGLRASLSFCSWACVGGRGSD
jgi:hypothetical protein